MSKTTLPKELEQQFDELNMGRVYDHADRINGLISSRAEYLVKQLIATAVAQAEERVKQQVLELIGSGDPTHYKEVSSEIRRYNEIRNELRQQLREKISNL